MLGTLPSITDVAIDFTNSNALISWRDLRNDSMPNHVAGVAGNGTIRDIFGAYIVRVYEHLASPFNLLATITTDSTNTVYTFDQNALDSLRVGGISQPYRDLRVDVSWQVKDSTQESSIDTTTSREDATNVAIDSTAVVINNETDLHITTISWDKPTDHDFLETVIETRPDGGNFTEHSRITGSSNTITWANVGIHDIRISHHDPFFGNHTYSPIVSVTPYDIVFPDLPEFGDELDLIRDPSFTMLVPADNPNGQVIQNIASTDYDGITDGTASMVTGFGMWAGTGTQPSGRAESRFIVAADEFAIAAGGHPAYTTGPKSVGYTCTSSGRIWHCIQAHSQVTPSYSQPLYWEEIGAGEYQNAFYINDGKVYIPNASIKELQAENIKANTITATEIKASTITSNEIQSDAIHSKHLKVSGDVANDDGVAIIIDPKAAAPFQIKDGTDKEIFGVRKKDGFEKAFVSGYADTDFIINPKSLTDDVKRSINQYYLGSAANTGNISPVQSAGTVFALNPLVTTDASNRVTVTTEISSAAGYINVGSSKNWVNPVWNVQIFRDATSIYNVNHTGSSNNDFDPELNSYTGSYSFNADISFEDTAAAGSFTYKVVLSRIGQVDPTNASINSTNLVSVVYAEVSAFIKNTLDDSPNGYWLDKDTGFQMCWGRVLVNHDTNVIITFPRAFDNYCASFTATMNEANNTDRDRPVKVGIPSSVQGAIYNTHSAGSDDFYYYWQAVGY